MEIDLPFIWAALIAFAVMAYVILDGFDLGVGLLFPFLGGKHERDLAMNSVAPVWDGNETWLILGGGGLFAVFPLAYATVLPALYAPLTAMLLGLIFRGVSFEFRSRGERSRIIWDFGFFGGSLVAGFSQGIALGALVQGIEISDRSYAGGWWDWLTPFSLLTGIALCVGYALLGSTWLIMKTDGPVAHSARRKAWLLSFAMLSMMGAVSLWTPFIDPIYADKWFSWPGILFSFAVPGLVGFAAFILFRGLVEHRDHWPFLATLSLFVLSFIGLGICFYPNIVPPGLTIWDAAGPDESLGFLLVGAVVLVPVILGYTAYAYWIFRGKVDPSEGYH